MPANGALVNCMCITNDRVLDTSVQKHLKINDQLQSLTASLAVIDFPLFFPTDKTISIRGSSPTIHH